MATTRSQRLELRTTVEEMQRILKAAHLAHRSVSSFVLEAASQKAEQVIADASVTTVPSDFFDALLAALDEPPSPNPALCELAERPHRVTQL
jgi:uncharacterized protein (DUF1778 family)